MWIEQEVKSMICVGIMQDFQLFPGSIWKEIEEIIMTAMEALCEKAYEFSFLIQAHALFDKWNKSFKKNWLQNW